MTVTAPSVSVTATAAVVTTVVVGALIGAGGTARPALIRTGVITALGALPIVGQLYVVLPLAAEIGALPGASGSTPALASTAFALVYAVGILALGPLAEGIH